MRKVKVICVFIILALLFASFVQASSPFETNLSTNTDWAAEALVALGAGRQIPGFSIPAEVNRNQGALLVARLLQHLSGEENLEARRFGVSRNVYLDNMIFTYNQRVTPERQLTASQVELLYRLVLEFRSELEILGYAIQDFNFLFGQEWQQSLDGIFAKRSLLYSEQALAAARKMEEEQKTKNPFGPEAEADKVENTVPKVLAEAFEPRNLWIGSYSSQARTLPSFSTFVAQEPIMEGPTPIQIGKIEVSGGLRPLESGIQPADKAPATEGGAGYGVSMRMGDLALNTAIDKLTTEQDKVITSTSVDLSLAWADLFTVSAGYKQLELPTGPDWEDIPPLVTSVGVEVPINRGAVHLGMIQEWPKFASEEGDLTPDDEIGKGAKNTAELGLRYEFENDRSLRLNYRFIDFSTIEHESSAEFSIKF